MDTGDSGTACLYTFCQSSSHGIGSFQSLIRQSHRGWAKSGYPLSCQIPGHADQTRFLSVRKVCAYSPVNMNIDQPREDFTPSQIYFPPHIPGENLFEQAIFHDKAAMHITGWGKYLSVKKYLAHMKSPRLAV